jgi:hypothetical protein
MLDTPSGQQVVSSVQIRVPRSWGSESRAAPTLRGRLRPKVEK